MNRIFETLRGKFRFRLILLSVLFGLSLGIFSASAIALIQKLSALAPNWILCIGVGAGVAALGFCLLFWLRYPTERRVAKELDDRLSLPEKVQTMIAFQNDESAMLTAQREDTTAALRTAPKKALRTRHLWVQILLPVLSCALLATAILMPVFAKEVVEPVTPPDTSDEWALTDWHITAVRELIETVRASDLVEEGKTDVIASLERILTDLQSVQSKKQMKRLVIAEMVKIDAVSDEINTYTRISSVLSNSPNTSVSSLSVAIGYPAAPIVVSKYQELRLELSRAESKQDALEGFAAAIHTALGGAEAPETDALYLALTSFAEALAEFAPEPFDEDTLTRIFEASGQEISAAMNQQNTNRTVTDNTNNRLMEIFGITWNELPEELTVRNDAEAGTENNEYTEKDEDIVHGGGLGGGEVIYGSDDAVYSPADETHVRYGDVIDEYDGKKTAALSERPLSDEMKEFIDKYFADLYYNNDND